MVIRTSRKPLGTTAGERISLVKVYANSSGGSNTPNHIPVKYQTQMLSIFRDYGAATTGVSGSARSGYVWIGMTTDNCSLYTLNNKLANKYNKTASVAVADAIDYVSDTINKDYKYFRYKIGEDGQAGFYTGGIFKKSHFFGQNPVSFDSTKMPNLPSIAAPTTSEITLRTPAVFSRTTGTWFCRDMLLHGSVSTGNEGKFTKHWYWKSTVDMNTAWDSVEASCGNYSTITYNNGMAASDANFPTFYQDNKYKCYRMMELDGNTVFVQELFDSGVLTQGINTFQLYGLSRANYITSNYALASSFKFIVASGNTPTAIAASWTNYPPAVSTWTSCTYINSTNAFDVSYNGFSNGTADSDFHNLFILDNWENRPAIKSGLLGTRTQYSTTQTDIAWYWEDSSISCNAMHNAKKALGDEIKYILGVKNYGNALYICCNHGIVVLDIAAIRSSGIATAEQVSEFKYYRYDYVFDSNDSAYNRRNFDIAVDNLLPLGVIDGFLYLIKANVTIPSITTTYTVDNSDTNKSPLFRIDCEALLPKTVVSDNLWNPVFADGTPNNPSSGATINPWANS